MVNKVILIGRLTKDPELRYTGNNRPVTQITVAVNRSFSNQNGEREADFINVVVWDKQAENVKNYLSKGRQVAVEGRIQTRNYDDKDGKKVYVTEVIANNVQFLESKSQTSGMSNNQTPDSQKNPYDFANSNNPEPVNIESDPFENFGNSIDISDDDLPF